MQTSRRSLLKIIAAGALPAGVHGATQSYGVEGDHFVLDGKPFVVRSGSMHYARVPREYWRDRMKKMRALGLNTLCTYAFWNLHEPRRGEYDFSGNLDIAAYAKTAQEEGLWVIVRPGPYACAEWEFGGFPWWLLQTRGIQVRTSDPRFLAAASKYMRRLLMQVAPLQITRGGPLIMVQVENEYGSFGDDHEYMNAIRKMIADSGIDVTLYTADGSSQKMLNGGTLPDLPCVVNFGGAPQREFENLAKFRPNGPHMCGEYWVGWFDHWGEKHHTGNNKVHLAGIDWMLERNIGFNLYMVHGGTSWGFMNGANFEAGKNGGYQPDISSYDYDSPIDEAGRPAPKFKLFQEVIRKHLPPDETLPPLPDPLPMISIPRFELKESASMFDLLRDPVRSPATKSFEELGQGYGYVLYRTRITKATSGKLEINELRDYGIVFQGAKRLGTLDRRLHQDSLNVTLEGNADLDILVENTGRVNYGPMLLDGRAGITQNVMLGSKPIEQWSMFKLPLTDLKGLKFSTRTPAAPAFYRAEFELQETGDTFFDLRGWGKGNIWVNGHNLGRHWHVGPQRSAFCPGVWLKKGRNEVVVLDLDEGGTRSIASGTDPIWETEATGRTIGLNTGTYGMKALKPVDALRAIAEIGYDGVELCLIAGWPTDPAVLGSSDRREIRQALQDTGLALPSLMDSLSILGDRAHNLERLKLAIALAHELSPDKLPVIETVLGGKSADWDQGKERIAEELRQWAQLAEDGKITVCFKPHADQAVDMPDRALWLLQQVNSPRIRIVYDYSHFQVQGLPLEATLRELLPYTSYIAVKDSTGDRAKHQFVLPGDGGTDYVAYLRLLKGLGYNGFVGVEITSQIHAKPGYDPIATSKLCYERLAPAFEKAGVARPVHKA